MDGCKGETGERMNKKIQIDGQSELVLKSDHKRKRSQLGENVVD